MSRPDRRPMNEAEFTKEIVAAMMRANIDGVLIYTFVKTGFVPTPQNRKHMARSEKKEIVEAQKEYDKLSPEQRNEVLYHAVTHGTFKSRL